MKTAIAAVAISFSLFSLDEIKDCFQRELDTCSDRVCEMSVDDNAVIIEQVRDNVIQCLKKNRK